MVMMYSLFLEGIGIQNWTYILVGITFSIYIGIAIWSRASSTKEFYVAGGGVSPLANGMATAADWMSAASFISMAGIISFAGYDGAVYLMGWTGGYVLLALLLAPYLRKFGKFTVPDFIGDRYYSNTARFVAVFCALLVSFTYVAGQMRGVGLVFSRFLEVDINTGVIIGMIIVLFYAVLGGMKGITYTQVAQYCVLIFAFMVPAIFIKSKSTLEEDYEPLNSVNIGSSLIKIYQSFGEAFKIKDFRKLCGATFLIFNAFNTVAALTFFVIVYKLFNGDVEASGIWVSMFGCLGALGTTFIVIPSVAWMSKKFGKKKAFMLSQSISLVGYVMLYFLFIPGKPWMYIIALPFFSFGIGSLFTIMMSMTADVIDIDEINTGKRREGIFGAIYWLMVKVGFGIAGALSGVIITFVGFNPDLATIDQQSAVDGIHKFFCFFPMAGTILAMLVMRDYSITEEKANEVTKALEKVKSKK